MQGARRSYLKTTASAVTVAVAASAAAAWLGSLAWPWGWLAVPVALMAAAAAAVSASGALVLWRDRFAQRGAGDAFLHFNAPRSDTAVSAASDGRAWRGGALRVGELVTVASLEEISATLDADGCLDGLPFMPEMARYCGQSLRVFRIVDKVYDYGRSKKMRAIDDCVLLVSTRCDGADHGGCQANCYLVWKRAWLRPPATRAGRAAPAAAARRVVAWCQPVVAGSTDRYRCQYTELAAASRPLPGWDPRQDWRAYTSGNVTFAAFAIAMLTRLFNAVQEWRGGHAFPDMPASELQSTPRIDLGLQPGELVRVLSADAIARTLDAKGRNRGMWFDRDMLKHSGVVYPIDRRIDRIIDDATGKMLVMKTPSVTLRGADSTGEYLRFNPQQDPLFWRECWLERAGEPVSARSESSATVTRVAAGD